MKLATINQWRYFKKALVRFTSCLTEPCHPDTELNSLRQYLHLNQTGWLSLQPVRIGSADERRIVRL